MKHERHKLERDDLAALVSRGLRAGEIAELTGVSDRHVRDLCIRWGLPLNIKPLRFIDVDRVRQLRAERRTILEICDELKCSPSALSALIQRHDIPRGKPPEPNVQRCPPQEATTARQAPSDVPAGLVATGGRYGPLSEWARANGVTTTRALQLWHRLRLAVGGEAR